MDRRRDLTRSRRLCAALIESAPDALLVVDDEGRIVLTNARAEAMFAYAREELLNQPIELLVPERFRTAHTDHRAAYAAAPTVRSLGGGPEVMARRRDGSEFAVEVALSPVRIHGGHLTIAVVRDVTDRLRYEEQLRFLGGHDALTGLYNRHAFEEEQARLARGRQFPVSVLVADVDGLKDVNDRFGHRAGDDLLRRAAAILGHAFRAEDTVARVGGDEFAALLPSTDRDAAEAAIGRIELLVERDNALSPGAELHLSVGAATVRDGHGLPCCLGEADAAMYRRKRSHPDRALAR